MKNIEVNPLVLTGLLAVFAATAFDSINDELASSDQDIDSITVCGDTLLVPKTLEQTTYLENHAGEAYAKIGPTTASELYQSPMVTDMFKEAVEQDKSFTITSVEDSGTSTLPDGTTRPMTCLNLEIK